ncbi:hypothetical protein [Roseburia sp. MSJ-14]|uniref:hypothetical protein n=1 Tax=Roseburia sp. MSJ-14 TaxID=2841514 RepID=UPI001C10CC0B|nr:hypothetical protein [Roseburia sp. MSJ-14]MBU5473974.1 hypothetical protein [Roseburia sp. MSJ-14]
MGKSKVIQMKKADKSQEARQILKNGILDMSIERLIQMTRYGLGGNINYMVGTCGSSHYFNHMEYVKADNEEEGSIINYSFMIEKEEIAASTTISIEQIAAIFGCVNEDNPDNVLDINIVMTDGSGITINIIY